MKSFWYRIGIICLTFFFLVGFARVVFAYDVASIPPVAGLVSEFLGMPVKSVITGHNAHHFQISPSVLKMILGADRIWMVNGKLEVEMKILDLLNQTNREKKVILLARDILLLDSDPHQWLSVRNLKVMVKRIGQVIGNSNVENKLLTQLKDIDDKISFAFARMRIQELLCLHPAWRYLCHDYGVKMLALMSSTGAVVPSRLRQVSSFCQGNGSFRFIVVEVGFEFSKLGLISKMCNVKKLIKFDPLAYDIISEFIKFSDVLLNLANGSRENNENER